MSKRAEAKEVYEEIIRACLQAKNRGRSKPLSRAQWFDRRRSSAFPILEEMERQMHEGQFDRDALTALSRRYHRSRTRTDYCACFSGLTRWPYGRDGHKPFTFDAAPTGQSQPSATQSSPFTSSAHGSAQPQPTAGHSPFFAPRQSQGGSSQPARQSGFFGASQGSTGASGGSGSVSSPASSHSHGALFPTASTAGQGNASSGGSQPVQRRPSLTAGQSLAGQTTPTPMVTALQEWVVIYDETSLTNYYCDLASGRTSWNKPSLSGSRPGERAQDWNRIYDTISSRFYFYNAVTGTSTYYTPALLDFSHIDRYTLSKVPGGARGAQITGANLTSQAGTHIECDQWVVVVDEARQSTGKALPEDRDGQPESGPDFEYAIALGTAAVRHARHLLPKGCFNNKRHDGSWVCAPENAKALYNQLDGMFTDLAYDQSDDDDWQPHDPLTQLSARFHATVAVKGGVCSALSAVVAGLVASTAESEYQSGAVSKYVTLQIISHDFDHSFVVLKYGDSPWICLDPWPANVYVIPWKHCCFEQSGVLKYLELRIHRKVQANLAVPFGVAVSDQALRAARAAGGVGGPATSGGQMHGIYHQGANIKGVSDPPNCCPPPSFSWPRVLEENDWGSGVAL